MQLQALPGFRDFFPADLALRSHIFRAWRAVATRYGFEEYDGPPLEPLELYTAKSGDEIVGQLYNFEDKGGRAVSLRPEMTPTLARMVAARANGLRKPIRWFSIPQLFRYERAQRGRLREHFQLNCDLIGEPGPLADAEIIALAVDVMREFGLTEKDVRVRLSDRRLLGALLQAGGVTPEQLGAAFQAIDKIERMPRDISDSFVSMAFARSSTGSACRPVSMRIASQGQASTQRPHTTQRSSSISNTAGRFSTPGLSLSSGMIVMQCAGHTVGQHMQATQRTVSSSRSVRRCRPRNRSG